MPIVKVGFVLEVSSSSGAEGCYAGLALEQLRQRKVTGAVVVDLLVP